MKKSLFLLSLVAFIMGWAGCKKCFNCINECTKCEITYNGQTFSHVTCRDSFSSRASYEATIASDTSIGYTCYSTSPTYNEDFCVNKPGATTYPEYYNKGGRVTCTQKKK